MIMVFGYSYGYGHDQVHVHIMIIRIQFQVYFLALKHSVTKKIYIIGSPRAEIQMSTL